jgi:hypothetical protein
MTDSDGASRPPLVPHFTLVHKLIYIRQRPLMPLQAGARP